MKKFFTSFIAIIVAIFGFGILKNFDSILKPLSKTFIKSSDDVAKTVLKTSDNLAEHFFDDIVKWSSKDLHYTNEIKKGIDSVLTIDNASKRFMDAFNPTDLKKMGVSAEKNITTVEGQELLNWILSEGDHVTLTSIKGHRSLSLKEPLQDIQILNALADEQSFKNVYTEKQPSYNDFRSLAKADLKLKETASEGHAHLIRFENDNIESMFDLIDSEKLLVIIGHSDQREGKQFLCLPNGEMVALEKIYKESSKRDIECVLVTCYSPDLENGVLDIEAASKACNLLGLMASRNQIHSREEAIFLLRMAILAEETKAIRITAVAATAAGGTYVVTASPEFSGEELEMLFGTMNTIMTITEKSHEYTYTRKEDEYHLTSSRNTSKISGRMGIKFLNQDEVVENIDDEEEINTDLPDVASGEYDRIKFYEKNGRAFLIFSSSSNIEGEILNLEDEVEIEFINGSWADYVAGKTVEVRIRPKDFELSKRSIAMQVSSQSASLFQSELEKIFDAYLKNQATPLRCRMPIDCTCEFIEVPNNVLVINQNTIEDSTNDPMVLKMNLIVKMFASAA